MALQPVVSLPVPQISGLVPSYVSATALSVSAGQCWMADADGALTYPVTVDSALTLSSATSGLGGLDTGTIANDTMYYIHVVADAAGFLTPGVIFSTSLTTPLLPKGASGRYYNIFKNVGFAKTNGSAQFLIFWTAGAGATRTHYWDTAIAQLNAGAATTLTAIDFSLSVPAIDNTPVSLGALYTSNAAGNTGNLVPGNSTSAAGVQFKNGTASSGYFQLTVLSQLVAGVPTIKYDLEASDNLYLYTYSFQYFL